MLKQTERQATDQLRSLLIPYTVVNDRNQCPPHFIIRVNEKDKPLIERTVSRKPGEGDYDFWDRVLDITSWLTTAQQRRSEHLPSYNRNYRVWLHADYNDTSAADNRKQEFIELLWSFAKGADIELKLCALSLLWNYFND